MRSIQPISGRGVADAVGQARSASRAACESLEGRRLLAVELVNDFGPQATLSSGAFQYMPVGTREAFFLTRDGSQFGRATLRSIDLSGATRLIDAEVFAEANGSVPLADAPVPATSGDRVIYFSLQQRAVRVADLSESSTQTVLTLANLGQPTSFTPLGAGWLFSTNNYFPAAENQRGLYYTDGTAAGTVRLTSTSMLHATIAADGTPLLISGTSRRELWTTDGTVAGTRLITALPAGSLPHDLTPLAGGTLFHDERDGTIWTTDGTAAGTRVVPQAKPANGLLRVPAGVRRLVRQADSALYLSDGVLYRTRGAANDAVAIQNLPTDWSAGGMLQVVSSGDVVYRVNRSTGEIHRINPDDTTARLTGLTGAPQGDGAGNLLLISGWRIVRTDGTTAGTSVVQQFGVAPPGPRRAATSDAVEDVRPLGEDAAAINGAMQSDVQAGYNFAARAADGRYWMTAADQFAGFEPFHGPLDRPALVADVNPTRAKIVHGSPRQLTDAGDGTTYFTVTVATTATASVTHLWRRDADGTLTKGPEIADRTIGRVTPASIELLRSDNNEPAVVDRATFKLRSLSFQFVSGRNIVELPDGSYLTSTMNGGVDGGGYYIMRARPGEAAQLVSYSSSSRATYRVVGERVLRGYNGRLSEVPLSATPSTPVDLGPADAFLERAVDVGPQLYYVGEGVLRVTDGTVAGTRVVLDGASLYGDASAGVASVRRAGDRFFLTTYDRRLIVTDGTLAGTRLVAGAQLDVGGGGTEPARVMGDRLLFRQSGALWSAGPDGAATRLSALPLVDSGRRTSNGGIAVVDGGFAVALATLPDGRHVVLRTDGTPRGTSVDARLTLAADATATQTPQVYAAAGRAYLTYNDPAVGVELFEVTRADRLAPFALDGRLSPDGRHAEFRFSETLAAGGPSLDHVRISHLTTGRTFAPASIALADDHTLRVGLTGLPDGDYRVTLASEGVRDTAGLTLERDAVIEGPDAFLLAGDVDRDRDVDFADLLALARNYGQLGKSYQQGNLDGSADGSVNFSDLLILAQGYGRSLAVQPPAAALADLPATRSKRTSAVDGLV